MAVRRNPAFTRWLYLLPMMMLLAVGTAFAGEADIKLPDLDIAEFNIFGMVLKGTTLLWAGLFFCALAAIGGIVQSFTVRSLPAHKAMLDVAELIYETCKTYLRTQAKLLAILWVFVAAIIFVYFFILVKMPFMDVLLVLFWSLVGIAGSFLVALYGMRMNTFANSRAAFASLRGKPLPVMEIPLQAGISIGILLICTELVLMLAILLLVHPDKAGACFMGFAVGESLGAAVLRICGGIFTKIADIGSDLMKIVFKIKEDDARNPGVIADCVGDNAGDSVGPTADGFETYGVTGVALVTFLALALADQPALQATLLVWLFLMRVAMVVTSLVSYWIGSGLSRLEFSNVEKMDFEKPLHQLVIITSVISVVITFIGSWLLLHQIENGLWWKLSVIISCGTVAGALIPVLTEAFTSMKSKHVKEITDSAEEGGASLAILSGLVAGNMSAFWTGMAIFALMGVAYLFSTLIPAEMLGGFPAVFAFGLVAFGFLSMGPVTIAVDSYGPVTDNAQSIFELSTIENQPGIKEEIERDFGFTPNFERAKDYLEENDGAGNTFKATAKPVLIGTAVTGATTMIFSLILLLKQEDPDALAKLSIIDPHILLGLILGGAVVYWFTGASMQAVTTGAYRAVKFIKENIKLSTEPGAKASLEDSNRVVEICTQYAQAGMFNIFFTVFFLALGFACLHPYLFVAYLVSIALFGLYQSVYMANAGGAWDNAKKLVEVVLKRKGSDLHAATVVGDTVGDPFKDTSSVALNPIIKFTTLFGLLAVEMAIKLRVENPTLVLVSAWVLIGLGLVFVWRSFYSMRIHQS